MRASLVATTRCGPSTVSVMRLHVRLNVRLPTLALLAALSAASACSTPPDTATPAESTVTATVGGERIEQKIDSTNERYRAAIFAKRAEEMASFYDVNAIVLSSTGGEVRGPSAIQSMMRGITAMVIDSLDYRPETFATSGDMAVQTATYRMVARDASGGAEQPSRLDPARQRCSCSSRDQHQAP